MRKLSGRIISAGLVLTLIITMIHVIPGRFSMDVTHAEENPGKVVRGVVDALSELPQYGVENFRQLERGSAERPFVVLELVPYEEYATFGYLIQGCEPIDIQNNSSLISAVSQSLPNAGTVASYNSLYLFYDELGLTAMSEEEVKQYALKRFGNQNYTKDWQADYLVKGYYELVAEGTGTFRYTLEPLEDAEEPSEPETETVSGGDGETVSGGDGGSVSDGDAEPTPQYTASIVPAPNQDGNLVWHTVNAFDPEYGESYWQEIAVYDRQGKMDALTEAIAKSQLSGVGERLYTWRMGSEYSDGYGKFISPDTYTTWTNNDNFLRYSVLPGASQETIDNYSVVVKTITPDELNSASEWIDYCDLIYIAAKVYPGKTFIDFWKQYNRLGKVSSLTNYSDSDGFDTYDISWDVTMKIFNRVTAESDYAGLIIDNNLYETRWDGSWKDVDGVAYDWNLRKTDMRTPTVKCSNKNIYKLCMMLISMKSNLFRQIYLNPDHPVIKEYTYQETITDGEGKQREVTRTTGELTLQSGDAAVYWGVYTFPLVKPGVYMASGDFYNYFTHYGRYDNEQWYNYGFNVNPTEQKFKSWVNGHVFTFPGDSNIVQYFMSGTIAAGYNETMSDDFYQSLSEAERNHASSKEAIRYILGGHQPDSPFPEDSGSLTLRVLDLEPSVGLNADGTPDWFLQESYVRMLLPHFQGKIEITHQTTAEFIGKIEDLNATYDLIYMGLDCSAYNTVRKTIEVNKEWIGDASGNGYWKSIYADMDVPVWNDTSGLKNLIYFHTGDSMTSAEYHVPADRDRSVLWVRQADGTVLNSTQLRFPGNDISLIKKADLQDFLRAGYPIVCDQNLYNLCPELIDSGSNVYAFVNQGKANANLLGTSSSAQLIETFANSAMSGSVVFNSLPKEYNGSTASGEGEDVTIVTNANYLDTYALSFTFTVTPADKEQYYFHIYMDQDRDSKFSQEEIVYTNRANAGVNNYVYNIDPNWVGVVQWKIEVFVGNETYEQDAAGNPRAVINPTGVRYARSGFSAIRNTSGRKKQINVLQIMPKEIDPSKPYNGALDLSKDARFTKYYDKLADYRIHVHTITWAEFESYFYTTDRTGRKTSKGFMYDYTRESDDVTNPVNLDKIGGNLDDYNMIIVGFGDTYGGVNLSNQYGAIDYLRYYVDQGKSILFTHDLTSLYNLNQDTFGYTVNSLMRDLMGMNRYKAISTQADNGNNTSYPKERWICSSCGRVDTTGAGKNNPPARCPGCGAGSEAFTWFDRESVMLGNYQAANAAKYDTTNSSAIQGYTYYSMKRLGWNNAEDNSGGGKMPYRYTIVNPKGLAVTTAKKHGSDTGFNNNNDLTTQVTMVNKGQITVYPYQIGETLTVAPTHGQWYALSPEDPQVTVWYALGCDPANVNAQDAGNDGSSVTYAVSPNDAMNNYYIYSKGNIFYSGVGHQTVNGDMEAKLFINTMIAAYNAAYVPPTVLVTNDEATAMGEQHYSIELLQNYDFGDYDASEGAYEQIVETFEDTEVVPVNFMPQDTNMMTTSLECTIYHDLGYGNQVYVDEVIELNGRNGDPIILSNGQPKTLKADPVTHVFTNLENGKYYRLYYPKNYLKNPVHDVYFTIKNDRVKKSSTSVLNMSVLPLFPLD